MVARGSGEGEGEGEVKVTRKTDFYVRVHPRIGPFPRGTRDSYIDVVARGECERVRDSIARHVDNVEQVAVCYKTETVCSFCGRDWESEDDECPVCCDVAVKEWEAKKAEVRA
jgi:hypothetical protein